MTIVGRTVSHYTVLEKLGEGGMGVVYKARDTRLERVAALKVLPADKVSDAERRRRFVQEAKAASALNHPNVVTIYDIDRDQDVDFIAMEYIAGRSLDRVVPKAGLRAGEALGYAVQIADGLAAAHAAAIIHRDLKPANIMVTEAGRVKLLDFGIAKLTETAGQDSDFPTASVARPATDEGTILGTVAYMSPEQAQGLKVDARSDIFSFGAVLYEMLTGRRAFSGDTKVSTLAAILDREPQPLAEATPRELNRIVTRCLKKDPARRFQTMADLKVALEELKEESDSGRLGTPVSAIARKSGLPLPVVAAAAIVVIAGTAGAWWLRGSTAPAAANQNRNLRQLTFDTGESSFPSLSPDAKLVAYQSDRAGAGRYDIWVQQTTGGSPIRLTQAPGDHRRPVFSGDGSNVYYESSGPPQGIYEVPALGGEARLIAASARLPRVSPDGRTLAYVSFPSAQLFVVPTAGGEARALAQGLSVLGGARLDWQWDSQRIAAFAQKTGRPETREWWLMALGGGAPQQQNWAHWAVDHHYLGTPDVSLPPNIYIASMARRGGEITQIYRGVNEDRTTIIIPSEPEALTSGAAWSQNATVAAGKMAFQSGNPDPAVWMLPADTDTGRMTGAMERLTPEKAVHSYVSATADGKTIVYSSNRTGSMEVVLRDLASGQERVLTGDAPESSKIGALIDARGTEVVYSMTQAKDGTTSDVYATPAGGGAKRKICDACGPTTSLSPDGKQVLSFQLDAARSHVNIVDVASGQSTLLLQHSQYPLAGARFSPDGKWISFMVTRGVALVDVVIAPFTSSGAIPESDWITVTENPGDIHQAFWSPNGGLLYFDLNTAGSTFLMARRLDANRRSKDAAFRVYEFAGHVRPSTTGITPDMLSAVPGRFVGVLSELDYNIWMMDLPK